VWEDRENRGLKALANYKVEQSLPKLERTCPIVNRNAPNHTNTHTPRVFERWKMHFTTKQVGIIVAATL
jgi:hypothetical protein